MSSQDQFLSETAQIDWVEYVQDSLVIELGYQDEDTGEPIDLTDSEVTMEIRQNKFDPTPLLVYSSTNGSIQKNVNADVQIKATVTDTQTQALGVGEFHYFIKIKDSANIVNTPIIGLITLEAR